jgi:dipeptidyl aminopeptidase/acylaminoacyl peptidase
MRHSLLWTTVAAACAAIAGSALQAAQSSGAPTEATRASAEKGRRFTVQDSIELATFLSPKAYTPTTLPVTWSPDGAHFLVVTLRGNLQTGKREATLWLFDADAVRTFARQRSDSEFAGARALARFSSSTNRQPVTSWQWTSDSRSVLYLGADDDGARRLYRVSIAGGEPVALTPTTQDVSRYDERNGKVVFLAHAPVRAGDLYEAGGPELKDMEVGTGRSVLQLLFPNWLEVAFDESDEDLWQVTAEGARPVVAADSGKPIRLKNSKLTMSPDGAHVVVTTLTPHIPKSWERYKPRMDYPGFQIVADTPETEGATGTYRPRQYTLIDLAHGSRSLLLDAPIDLLADHFETAVTWSADGSRVALLGAYPALASVPASQDAIYPCTIMVVDVGPRTASCALAEGPLGKDHASYGDRRQIVGLHWAPDAHAFEVEEATPNAPANKIRTRYSQSGARWKATPSARQAESGRPVVEIQQGIDQPPVLTVQVNSRATRTLLDPNPQLRDIALGSAELYHWRDADGDEWQGALVKPPGFDAQKRYPLVIQTHQLDRSVFLVDGPSATGFAARAFAARDILVLQVDELNKNSGTPKESATGAAGYRAAIKQLAAEGHIDPHKVGITTWSHMGPYAMQGIVEEPHAYAAATFAEAAYNSYGEYLINIDYMGTEREKMFRAQFGPQPFGAGLKTWVDNNVGFHTDRVCTPILWQVNSPPALVYGWDAYAALRAQGKPIDLFYIRNGDHVLVKPWQRLAEQGMNVDWFDYWLNGHKDSDPAKRAQYARWDLMKPTSECAVRTP